MRLQKLFSTRNGVYMAHMYYGDPSADFSLKAMKLMCDHGVDIIEFGIPFSDPNADGPVFQRACERALKAGMTIKPARASSAPPVPGSLQPSLPVERLCEIWKWPHRREKHR